MLMQLSENDYMLLATLMGAGIATGASLFIFWLESRTNRENEIRLLLTQMVANLYQTKEYWFLIAEYYYLEKYDNIVRQTAMKKKYVLDPKYVEAFENSITDYEGYRTKMIDIQTEMRQNLAQLSGWDFDLSQGIRKDIESLRLNKWRVGKYYLDLNPAAVNSGFISRKSVSHYVNKGINSKGEIGYDIEVIINKIEEKI